MPKITNVFQFSTGFKVIQTGERSQSAIMTLEPGESSGEKAESHPHSDQTLIVLEGELRAEVGGKSATMRKGDAVTVLANTRHKFTNTGRERAVTFSVYSPPAYPPGASD
jgi:mannose-6-phosphate isomerase-like protein (cupin superfamily)